MARLGPERMAFVREETERRVRDGERYGNRTMYTYFRDLAFLIGEVQRLYLELDTANEIIAARDAMLAEASQKRGAK